MRTHDHRRAQGHPRAVERVSKNSAMSSPSAQRLSLQCNDGEQAQAFLSRIYVPLRVTARGRDPVDFETHAVHCGGLGFSTSTSRSGIQLILDEPFDGYGMSMPLAGSMSVASGGGEPTTSRANGGLMMDSRAIDASQTRLEGDARL